MIAEVATVVTVADSDVDMQVILRSAAKAADELAKATEASEQKEKSLSVHSVVQHQQSQKKAGRYRINRRKPRPSLGH